MFFFLCFASHFILHIVFCFREFFWVSFIDLHLEKVRRSLTPAAAQLSDDGGAPQHFVVGILMESWQLPANYHHQHADLMANSNATHPLIFAPSTMTLVAKLNGEKREIWFSHADFNCWLLVICWPSNDFHSQIIVSVKAYEIRKFTSCLRAVKSLTPTKTSWAELESSNTLSGSWTSSSSKEGYVTISIARDASRNSQKPSILAIARYHLVSWFLTFLFIWPTLERSRRNSCVATVFPPLNSSREWTEPNICV